MKNLSIEMQQELVGKKWNELSQEIKNELLKSINIYQSEVVVEGGEVALENPTLENGDCIVDLTEYLSISGKIIVNDEITIKIEDDEKIYNPIDFPNED